MGFDFNSFDADTAIEEAPKMEFKPYPEGVYKVVVESAEAKQSSTGKEYFSIKYLIMDGEYEGKPIFDNLFMSKSDGSPNPFSRAKLGALVKLCLGSNQISDIGELASGVEFEIQLKIVKDEYKGQTREKNNVYVNMPSKKSEEAPKAKAKPAAKPKAEPAGERPDFNDDDM
jgi:hypothetical protein